MPDDRDPPPLPPPLPDPAALELQYVRSLVSTGHVSQAVELAVAGALRAGKAAPDRYAVPGGPPSPAEEARRRFLGAVRAAGEELDGIALAVAEGAGQAEEKGS